MYARGSAMDQLLQAIKNDLSEPPLQLPVLTGAGRRSLDEKIARTVAADRGERGDTLVGAALGAPRNVAGLVALREQHRAARDLPGERPRLDLARGADRCARAGDDAATRVAPLDDEVEPTGRRRECPCIGSRQADDKQPPAGR